MAYLGNSLSVQQYAPQVAYFSGNGSTTAFTLPVPVVSAGQIIVSVANVIQNPNSAYSVSGSTLTFTSAPPSGTNNIWVEYTSLQTNTIAPSAGTVGTSQLSASGTASALTFLSGGNTWVSPFPSGTILHFAMSTAPSGWLACDGSAVSRTTYASLFSAIGTTYGSGDGSTTFNLPNAGGQFIRNWVSGQSTDSGRTFGSTQADQFQGHYHSYSGGPWMTPYPSGGGASSGGGAAFTGLTIGSPTTDGTNGTPRTGSETRPTNIAFLICIKY